MQKTMYNISLCWEDIKDSGKIRKGNNGKHYFPVTIAAKKEMDRFGNDATAWMTQSKEEREAQVPKKWVGNGNMFVFDDSVSREELDAMDPDVGDDGMPF